MSSLRKKDKVFSTDVYLWCVADLKREGSYLIKIREQQKLVGAGMM